jgi:A/G-specific adenine glycosylase
MAQRCKSCYNLTMNETNMTIESSLQKLPDPLLAWFRANARDLPWRQTRDPYRIWVSEIMLQQTRVAAVLGYYDRFLAAFPSVEALAAAPQERLMKLWEGLGYYSRARNLQRAAQIVAAAGGSFPDSYEGLLSLPGIGEYTAGAIASAAFGLRVPAVDGNVLRVVTRLTDCHADIMDPATKKMVREQVEEILPQSPQEMRIFNQATMELGATVCVPNGPPQCEVCPASAFCLGRIRETAERLPVKKPKKARQEEELTVFLMTCGDKVALRKRGQQGLLAGLWEFPNVPGTLEEAAAAAVVEGWGLSPKAWEKKLNARHIFTHREWHMTGYTLTVTGTGPEEFRWVDAEGLAQCAVPSAFARYTAELLERWKEDA